MTRAWPLVAATLLTLVPKAATSADSEAAESLAVLSAEGGVAPNRLLYEHFAGQSQKALDRRRDAFEKLSTPEEQRDWQKTRREFFLQQIGGFPERTPLNARVVGSLNGGAYRVEKILYESRPQHRVTAVLYLPKTKPPHPAVLIACGHSKTGKAAEYNQRMGILLAAHGVAAMCYDPIGQGERSQILTTEGKPKYRASTTEHFLTGVGAILVGANTASYRIWDGVRGIDYLCGRDDIDPERIGCTGCSGGGTLTSYIMALDDRVACAAPACYVTTFERLIATIGPQDAEQNIFAQVAEGMEQTDYALMRAPKPTLICATTDDFFDIRGSWDTFRQAKRFYGRFGRPQNVSLVEADGRHGVTKLSRETLTHWMRRWLLGVDEPITDDELPVWKGEELRCTPEGEVLLLPEERSVFDLNAERAEAYAADRGRFEKLAPEEARKVVRETAGVRPLDELPRPDVQSVGSVARDGYAIRKLVLRTGSIPLPALRFVPEKPTGEEYLYLHGEGKAADAAPGGPIERLVREGHAVLAVDLSSLGETRGGGANEQLGDWKNFFMAYLLGHSLVGMRAEDTLVAARYLRDGENDRIHVVAIGEAAIPALHAVSLAPEKFATLRLRQCPKSWLDVVRTPEAKNQLTGVIHGALQRYDLPQLVSLASADVEVTLATTGGGR